MSRFQVALLLFPFLTVIVSAENCLVDRIQAEKCAKRVFFFGSRDSAAPEKVKLNNVKAYCINQLNNIKCLEEYSNCSSVNDVHQQILELSITSLRQTLAQRCSDQISRKGFYRSMRCIDGQSVGPVNGCVDRLVSSLRFIKRKTSVEDHVPGICCSFNLFKDCIFLALKHECDYASHPKTMEEINRVVSGQIKTIVDLNCDNLYGDLKSCKKNAANITSVAAKRFARKRINPQRESVYFLLIDIVAQHFGN